MPQTHFVTYEHEVHGRVASPARFMRVHRSFIVQKDKIRIIDRGRIVFDKTYIPVSDSYKRTFKHSSMSEVERICS